MSSGTKVRDFAFESDKSDPLTSGSESVASKSQIWTKDLSHTLCNCALKVSSLNSSRDRWDKLEGSVGKTRVPGLGNRITELYYWCDEVERVHRSLNATLDGVDDLITHDDRAYNSPAYGDHAYLLPLQDSEAHTQYERWRQDVVRVLCARRSPSGVKLTSLFPVNVSHEDDLTGPVLAGLTGRLISDARSRTQKERAESFQRYEEEMVASFKTPYRNGAAAGWAKQTDATQTQIAYQDFCSSIASLESRLGLSCVSGGLLPFYEGLDSEGPEGEAEQEEEEEEEEETSIVARVKIPPEKVRATEVLPLITDMLESAIFFLTAMERDALGAGVRCAQAEQEKRDRRLARATRKLQEAQGPAPEGDTAGGDGTTG